MASESGPIKVLHFGLGPIGAGVVKQVAERKGFKIVGAVDIDPAKAGRDLGVVAGVGRPLKVKVSDNATKAIKSSKPDVVVLCTSSSMKNTLPQMETILKLRVPIVSTTEELAYPTKANMRYARVIHQLAKKAKVAVLGTGVNPGFAMDALPITIGQEMRAWQSQACASVSTPSGSIGFRMRALDACRSSRRSARA